jgi:hypothetical protein
LTEATREHRAPGNLWHRSRPGTAAKVERATNLIDLINISQLGLGRFPEPDLAQLIAEKPLEAALDEKFGAGQWERTSQRWLPDRP